jgi:single-strand DNA-binding protein
MINRVVLTGRLTRDLELRRTQSGTSVVSFTLAVDRNLKKEGQPEADFINCVAWNRQADTMAQYLHRGSLIGVDGRLQTRNYENQQGQRVYITEVLVESFTFLEPRNQAQAQEQWSPTGVQPQTEPTRTNSVKVDDVETIGIAGDDLPF